MRSWLITVACALAVAGCDSAANRHGGATGPGGTTGSGNGTGTGTGTGSGNGPVTCADAAAQKSYIGCDYWPTVTANPVMSDFDYAVVVANTGATDAAITVTGPNGTNQNVTVAANQLQKIFLPWVPALKNGDNTCGSVSALSASALAPKSAYHLVSTVPVVVYQFSALEYKPAGGPPGKDWSACMQKAMQCDPTGTSFQCFSYSNDASLLLPSTALTGNYRVTGWHSDYGFGQLIAVTATQDGTNVTVKLPATSAVLAGSGVTAIAGGQSGSFTLNQGDVLQLVSYAGGAFGSGGDVDPSGALVKADKPVQVIAGDYCTTNPKQAAACDHVEESVFPAEALGQHYLVSAIPGPQGKVVAQTVRIIGNVDGTHLQFNPSVPGAPSTIDAGQAVDIGPTDVDFEVKGDHAFAVETMMQGGSVVDPGTNPVNQRGDPSQSLTFAVEQFRAGYLFLAPSDYDVSFLVVTAPTGAKLMLDGAAVSTPASAIGSSGFGTVRIELPSGGSDAHTLTSDQPVGIQVLGYGQYTSYQYPGGGNLVAIAPPPIG